MPATAQALREDYLTEISKTGRVPSLRDLALSYRHAAEVMARRPVRASAPAAANDDAPAALVPEVVTKAASTSAPIRPVAAPVPVPEVVTKAPARTRRKKRRSGLRQREDARDMRAAARVRAGEAVKHLHHAPTTSSTPTSTSTKPTTTKTSSPTTSPTTKTSTGRGRLIADWNDAGDLPRLISINRGLDRFGVPYAFSLNISPDLIAAGNDNDRGLLDHMRRRIALTLKRTLGEAPPMWVAVETDDDGREHMHGGIALTDRHVPAVVLGALAKAGGNWTTQGSAPADLRRQHDPDGWAAYPLKRAPRTRRDLRQAAGLPPGARVNLYAVSADLLVEGKRRHEEERRSIGRR